LTRPGSIFLPELLVRGGLCPVLRRADAWVVRPAWQDPQNKLRQFPTRCCATAASWSLGLTPRWMTLDPCAAALHQHQSGILAITPASRPSAARSTEASAYTLGGKQVQILAARRGEEVSSRREVLAQKFHDAARTDPPVPADPRSRAEAIRGRHQPPIKNASLRLHRCCARP
jgi:hypothetical protein